MSDVLLRLQAVIDARKTSGDAAASHTAALLAKGPLKCAQKFGEEAVEAALAVAAEDDEAVIGECADTLYHMAVMLASRGLSLADVLSKVEKREGVSGLVEKASRTR